MTTGPTAKTRAAVLARDAWSCVSCGRHINAIGHSVHHRVPRGMGGSKLPWVNLPGNLLVLCGSGTTGCHGWVESHREKAYEWGYLIPRYRGDFQLPEFVRILTPHGWVLFDNDCGRTYVQMTSDDTRFASEWETARLTRMGMAA